MYDFLGYVTLALIPGFILLDLFVRARRYAAPRFWRLRALAVTVAIFCLSGWIAGLWGTLFENLSLLDGGGLGTLGGAAVGVLVYELAHYGYHRAAHEWSGLWRAGHQMHHSAESLDAFGAYYLHPLDAAAFTTLSSLVFFPLLGLTVEAGIVGALFLTFNAMFQHANIRTPYWLGFIIQRPESHNIHHGRGVHRYNYADLPVIDMLFGTLRNPRALEDTATGFYSGASGRIVAMLIGRDVSVPARAGSRDGSSAAAPSGRSALREAA
ncbi:MAG TPA: sterol desaturase family protein [Gammaproteobacteria bacterium]|nr:sterol desaturase family protein [Gammaproteobacteria bacterium]